MKINSPRRRKAISPVLATVILIAITLIAAIAIAGFVFGLFGTFTSGPHLQLSTQSCTHGVAGNLATSGYCTLQIANTGGASGAITGCILYGTAGTIGTAAPPPEAGTTVTIAAGTAAPGITVDCAGGPITAGAAVSGSLTVASGSPLAFSAIAS